MRGRGKGRSRSCLIILTGFLFASALAAEEEPAAEWNVKGYGLFGNRELKSLISILQKPGVELPVLDANHIEDAVMILFSRVQRDGYLNPTIAAEVTLETGERREFIWTEPLGEPLPRPLAARRVVFRIKPRTLFYIEEARFAGLSAMSLREAASYFMETDALIPLKKNRIYTPERVRSGTRSLEEALARHGYEAVRVTITNLVVRSNTGAVTFDVMIDEGPQTIVRSIEKAVQPVDTNQAARVQKTATNLVYSRMWEQDFAQSLRREQYTNGFADVRVEITQLSREAHAETNYIDLRATVYPGEQIRVGEVRFEGEKHTRESMMRRRVELESGELLNPILADRGRYRLARLGIFDAVDLRYDKVSEPERDVVYTVDEANRINFSLLAGWGSYEMLRVGFEWEQYNLWGLAHHSRLKAVQSFKSSSAEYNYTMPELLGEDFDVFLNASWLRREEVSFTREEFGGGAGVARRFREIDTDLALRYNYQVLIATRADIDTADGLREATVGSFVFDVRHDRRDNPLMPRTGYKVFSSLEIASEALLGEVDFQRMETSISYHLAISRLQWLHFGISHGFVTTASGPSRDLPFNKRFFPGGDNSIRGYQFGEAAPRNERGREVGAETYTLANIEFEQGLTRTWSVVFFFDALGQARRIEDYPFNEGLYSIGAGIRWKSIIGPVRLEYGHNLNPREHDPSGTVHLSIGFPF